MDINKLVVRLYQSGAVSLSESLLISSALWFVVACRNTEKKIYDELIKTYGNQLDELK